MRNVDAGNDKLEGRSPTVYVKKKTRSTARSNCLTLILAMLVSVTLVALIFGTVHSKWMSSDHRPPTNSNRADERAITTSYAVIDHPWSLPALSMERSVQSGDWLVWRDSSVSPWKKEPDEKQPRVKSASDASSRPRYKSTHVSYRSASAMTAAVSATAEAMPTAAMPKALLTAVRARGAPPRVHAGSAADDSSEPPSPRSFLAGSIAEHDSMEPPAPRLRAGSTDDNADPVAYDAFLNETLPHCQTQRADALDVRAPIVVRVVDAKSGRPVPGANVSVVDPASGRLAWQGLTYGDGETIFYPALVPPARGEERRRHASQTAGSSPSLAHGGTPASGWVVTAAAPGSADGAPLAAVGFHPDKDDKRTLTIALAADVEHHADERVPIDVAFVIDSTGSMGDEIARLKTTLLAVVRDLERSVDKPIDLRFGAIAYRDRGDEYLLKLHPFTNNVQAFSASLDAAVFAGGGGDGPESLNEALVATANMGWRPDAAKLAFLVADAPPHNDYDDEDATYGTAALGALHRGIRIHTVAASGLEEYGSKCGTLVFRQVAQLTRGKFIFLEYGNQPAVATAAAMGKHGVTGTVVSNNLDDILRREIKREVDAFGAKA